MANGIAGGADEPQLVSREPGERRPTISLVVGLFSDASSAREHLAAIVPAIERLDYEVVLIATQAGFPDIEPPAPIKDLRIVRADSGSVVARWNAGLDSARGDFIVLLDAQVVPDHKAIKEFAKRAGADDRIGVVGGRLLQPNGNVASAGLEFDAEAGFAPRLRGSKGNYFLVLQDATVAAMDFGMVLISRAARESVGELDARMSLFYAGVDFCLRAECAGFRTLCTRQCAGVDERGPNLFDDPAKMPSEALLAEVMGFEVLGDKWQSGFDDSPSAQKWSAQMRAHREELNRASEAYLRELSVSDPPGVLAWLLASSGAPS